MQLSGTVQEKKGMNTQYKIQRFVFGPDLDHGYILLKRKVMPHLVKNYQFFASIC